MIVSSIILLLLTFSSESDFIKEYFDKTEYRNVANVIVAISRLETGHYKSKAHISRNNYFSYKDFKHPECRSKPIYCLKTYRTIEESCKDLLEYLRRKDYSTSSAEDFYRDLVRNRYAEDENYINILRKIKVR